MFKAGSMLSFGPFINIYAEVVVLSIIYLDIFTLSEDSYIGFK